MYVKTKNSELKIKLPITWSKANMKIKISMQKVMVEMKRGKTKFMPSAHDDIVGVSRTAERQTLYLSNFEPTLLVAVASL